ncbi:MAG: hypothetical protein JNK46_18535 [Methylobacteriaceae bacterium]|nr:hypothetical protein [Methylobacteriaceae bacterium]
MRLVQIALFGAAALLVAGPAAAQWPPPPPPFVTNPQLNPPAARPAVKAMTPAEQRAQRQAERRQAEAARRARTEACHRQADTQNLRGRARRQFVAKCRG